MLPIQGGIPDEITERADAMMGELVFSLVELVCSVVEFFWPSRR